MICLQNSLLAETVPHRFGDLGPVVAEEVELHGLRDAEQQSAVDGGNGRNGCFQNEYKNVSIVDDLTGIDKSVCLYHCKYYYFCGGDIAKQH